MTQPWYALRPASSSSDLQQITTGAITDAVSYLDFALSGDYRSYKLELIDVVFSHEDSVALVFGDDSVWLSDLDNFDTYANLFNGTDSAGGPVTGTLAADSTMFASPSLGVRHNVWADITPGSAGWSPILMTRCVSYRPFNGRVSIGDHAAYLKPDANVVPTYRRMTRFRIGPYGNSDLASPTIDTTLTSGGYALWGVQ